MYKKQYKSTLKLKIHLYITLQRSTRSISIYFWECVTTLIITSRYFRLSSQFDNLVSQQIQLQSNRDYSPHSIANEQMPRNHFNVFVCKIFVLLIRSSFTTYSHLLSCHHFVKSLLCAFSKSPVSHEAVEYGNIMFLPLRLTVSNV